MTESEAPLTPGERLAIVSLYARLTVSQNRTVAGRLGSESACYADLNIHCPRTLSHKTIPVSRAREGSETC